MGIVTAENLSQVFGEDSTGTTAAERAVSSRRRFVRSQVQITFASERAAGRVLSAFEALQTFGLNVLLKVASEGFARIVDSADEPAATLSTQREELGLTVAELSKRSGVSEAEISKAETRGALSSIRTLERLGTALALDERKLGFVPNPGRDKALGVRLRELKQADTTTFGPKTVLDLSESAWVVSRQNYLAKALGIVSRQRVMLPGSDSNFSNPPYRVGYQLAERTRLLLGLSDDEPIASLRILIEEILDVPLVQQSMDDRFAGATIANGKARGIVVNERGMNANVWVRRMTLCHEVGHLIWDPDDRLEQLKVDEYADLERNAADRPDPVEVRANAFAAAFLAPPAGVARIAQACNGDSFETVSRVMTRYGISASAAKHHVQNMTGLDTSHVYPSSLPLPDRDWISAEELSIAFFPISSTPITRRGKFAWFVAKSVASGILTEDTAGTYLRCEPSEITDHIATILSMWPEGVTTSLGVVTQQLGRAQ